VYLAVTVAKKKLLAEIKKLDDSHREVSTGRAIKQQQNRE